MLTDKSLSVGFYALLSVKVKDMVINHHARTIK